MKKYNLNLYNICLIFIIVYFFYFKIFYYESDLWADEQFTYWLINPIINFDQFFHLIFKMDIFQISYNLILKLLFYIIPYNVENSITITKFFSLGSIIVIFFISKNYLFKKNTLMISALVSSVFILNHLSDELRAYSFSIFFVISSFYFYLKYKKDYLKINLGFFLIFALIAVTSQIFTVLFIISILIFELIQYFYKQRDNIAILSIIVFLFLIAFFSLICLATPAIIENKSMLGELNITALLSLYLPYYLSVPSYLSGIGPILGRIFSIILFICIFYYLKNLKLKFDYNIIFIIHLILSFITVFILRLIFGTDFVHPKYLLFVVISAIFLISNIDLKKFDNLKEIFLFIYLFFAIFQSFLMKQNADLSFTKIFTKVQETKIKDYLIKTRDYDLKIKYENIDTKVSNSFINYIFNSKFFDKELDNFQNKENLPNRFWLICNLNHSKCINNEDELIVKFDLTKIINENDINAYLFIKKE